MTDRRLDVVGLIEATTKVLDFANEQARLESIVEHNPRIPDDLHNRAALKVVCYRMAARHASALREKLLDDLAGIQAGQSGVSHG
jgi:hypothetical protein